MQSLLLSTSEYVITAALGVTENGKEHEAMKRCSVIVFIGTKSINYVGGLIGCGHPVGALGA